jgi:malonyl-CoA O-methyltransferase
MTAQSADTQKTAMQSAPISLTEVRRLFARTNRVQASQFLRREISARMFERLSLIKTNPKTLCDAGCGEGDDLLVLRSRFPHAVMCGVDASQSMLAQARLKAKKTQNLAQQFLARLSERRNVGPGNAILVGANFAHLPLRESSLDLVWSNLALHWHPQPDRVFAEWKRVLQVDGLLMFSCFGPTTFKPLRDVFTELGHTDALLPFVDLHDLGDMLVAAGFATPVMDMEILNITYSSIENLFQDIRAFGGNPLLNKRKALLGKRLWAQVRERLEQSRQPDGKIHLSVEVINGHAFRPAPKQRADGTSIIRFDDLRK